MAKVGLTRGLFAKVDKEDLPRINHRKWYADPSRHTHYARMEVTKKGEKARVYMHRLIIGAKKGQVVDHINGDGLDNRRANLRICSYSRNGLNRARVNNPHGHIGITWDKNRRKWRAQIVVDYKRRNLGRFDRKADAIKARQAAMAIVNEAFAQAERELA